MKMLMRKDEFHFEQIGFFQITILNRLLDIPVLSLIDLNWKYKLVDYGMETGLGDCTKGMSIGKE